MVTEIAYDMFISHFQLLSIILYDNLWKLFIAYMKTIWLWLFFFDTSRLAGAALLALVINYWWPDLPANLTAQAYYQMKLQDQWALRVAHYTPWLTYWWNTQRWFPISTAIARSPDMLSKHDKELVSKLVDSKKSYEVRIKLVGDHNKKPF